jgi:hypothetical protein
MNVHSDSDLARFMKTVGAAQDFGLSAPEVETIAEEALERHDSLSDAREWAAGVLAARVLAKVRTPISPVPAPPKARRPMSLLAAAAAGPLLAGVAVIVFTRALFGIHFPFDVLIGAAVGYELALLSARLVSNARPRPGMGARRSGRYPRTRLHSS